MLVISNLLLIFVNVFDPVRPDLDQTICTLMVETTRSVASGLRRTLCSCWLTLCLLFLCHLLIMFANRMEPDQT